MAWTMRKQHEEGRWFLFENPPGELWDEPEFVPIWTMEGVYSALNHMCQWGARHRVSGLPIKKKLRFASNNLAIGAQALLSFGADPDAHGPPFDVAMDAEAKDVLAVLERFETRVESKR